MKLIFREYLASLRERKELDAVLPDLLSELGYTVISRPSIGTRQYGVDVAALGLRGAERQKLYLFSIKQGDLTRTEWDGPSPQALRTSLNEILDVYATSKIARAHQNLDIVICVCIGGEIQEAVRDNVVQFTNTHTRGKISFELWNGDYMAGLLAEGVLKEQLVGKAQRSSFQKAIAMLDQPEVAIIHFSSLMEGLFASDRSSPQERATILRQVYICLWVLFVWARDAGNLEAPYQLSEIALLKAWGMCQQDVAKSTKPSEALGVLLSELANLHFEIWDAYVGEKILPFSADKHALSSAVPSHSSVDISLRLFQTIGRISMRGLWLLWEKSGSELLPKHKPDWLIADADALSGHIIALINCNPLLLTPVSDAQVADVTCALLFLSMMGNWQKGVQSYLDALIVRIVNAYRMYGKYPIAASDYRSLINYPTERNEAVRKSQTKASTLIPILAVWASSCGASKGALTLSAFANQDLEHCAMQLWGVGKDTESNLYEGKTVSHGLAILDVPITADGEDATQFLVDECKSSDTFDKLSAIRLGHWPLVVLACRHQNLPLPPNLWLPVLQQMRAKSQNISSNSTSDGEQS